MFRKNDGSQRRNLWLTAAVIAPVGSLYAGNWLAALFVSALCGGAAWLFGRFGKPDNGIALAAAQCLWMGVVIGNLLPHCLECWESDSCLIPMVLLALSAYAAMHSAERASKVAAVLFGGVIFIVGGVLLAGSKYLRLSWVTPEIKRVNYELVPIFLLPCLMALPQGRRVGRDYAFVAVPGVLLPLWLAGALSPRVAAEVANPLYEYSKSVVLFGVAERVESLVSCAMTASWFCVLAWMLSAASQFAEGSKIGFGRFGAWGCAAVAGIVYLCNLTVPGELTALGSLLFWVAIPLAAQCFAYVKKVVKKSN